MKKIILIGTVYLICAFVTCLMVKNILGIGDDHGLKISHTITTGYSGHIEVKHAIPSYTTLNLSHSGVIR